LNLAGKYPGVGNFPSEASRQRHYTRIGCATEEKKENYALKGVGAGRGLSSRNSQGPKVGLTRRECDNQMLVVAPDETEGSD